MAALLGRFRVIDRAQGQEDRGERLAGLVVELSREPAALQLLRGNRTPKRVALDAARRINRNRSALRVVLGELQIVRAETLLRVNPTRGDDDAERPVAGDERNHDSCLCTDPRDEPFVGDGEIGVELHNLAPSGDEYAGGTTGGVERHADERAVARGRNLEQARFTRKRNGNDPCAEQLAQIARDEVEQARQLDLSRQSRGDLIQRFELARATRRRFVEPRVLDRNRRLRREQRDNVLVALGEVAATDPLSEVEIAVRDAAQQDRDAEERVHRRMIRRYADRTRVGGEVVQPERSRVPHEHAEDPATARQHADRSAILVADSVRDELLELGPLRIEDPERRVPGAGQLGSSGDEQRQQSLQIELGAQRNPSLDQRAFTPSRIFSRISHRAILPRPIVTR